jgi:hypothetical protein
MAALVRRLLRGLAVILACGSLSACVVGTGQPYGGGYYRAPVYAAPVYGRGYFGPGSGTGYGRYYDRGRGYFGPGSGTGYGRYYGRGGWR